MYCKNCGNEIDNNAAVCVSCGYSKGTGNKFCANCQSPVMENADFCTSCGAKLNNEPVFEGTVANNNSKSKLAAGILGILVGGLGIHNFYLGYTKRGLIQLLISVLSCGTLAFASSIWGLVEGILILTGSIAVDADGVPLKD